MKCTSKVGQIKFNFGGAFLMSKYSTLHEEYSDTVKLALEVYEKFKKLNKDFVE